MHASVKQKLHRNVRQRGKDQKAKIESGTTGNSRRQVEGEAGSKLRGRHKMSHSPKGSEQGGPEKQGPEEVHTSPQLEKGIGEGSGRD